MSSLRRDLVQRKLWMVVALLVVAIVAVPVLLLKSSGAAGGAAVPLPPSPASTPATTTTATTAEPAPVPVKQLISSIPRNPFASGQPKLSSKPASPSKSESSSSSTGSSSTTATSQQAAMVSPTPSDSGSSSDSSSGSAASSSGGSGSATATVASAPTTRTVVAPPSWTVYSVAVRSGKTTTEPVHHNIAWLTPLPSATQPDALFLGVMAGGQQAAFALGSGLVAKGPGLCRPAHTQCDIILLKAGQTEQLLAPNSKGAEQQRLLHVVQISGQVTHSARTARAAAARFSSAGVCDLGGAEPVLFDPVTGTLESMPKVTCSNQATSPLFSFPGATQ